MTGKSSDVTDWLPALCCRCGRPVVRSRQGFGCSYVGAGTMAKPEPTVWHVPRCPEGT